MLRLATAVAVLAAVLVAPSSPARAAGLPAPAVDGIYPMVFPVGGETHFTNTFGAPRSGGRTHEGTDLMADKMVPVVAAASGTIGWVSSSCCALEIEHDDGWSSMYIHLNNDTPGTDDGLGWGIMPGLVRGVHVDAGQLIGWVGDSGNAEWTGSHLHFELHTPDGIAISSYEHLLEARGAAEGRMWPPTSMPALASTARRCWAGYRIPSTSGSPVTYLSWATGTATGPGLRPCTGPQTGSCI